MDVTLRGRAQQIIDVMGEKGNANQENRRKDADAIICAMNKRYLNHGNGREIKDAEDKEGWKRIHMRSSQ